MRGQWALALVGTRCGYGQGHDLEAGEPVYLITRVITRCEAHAPDHARLTDAERDALCHAREALQAAQQATRSGEAPAEQARTTAGSEPGFTPVAAAAPPSDRPATALKLPAPRAPRPFAEVASTLPPTSDSLYD